MSSLKSCTGKHKYYTTETEDQFSALIYVIWLLIKALLFDTFLNNFFFSLSLHLNAKARRQRVTVAQTMYTTHWLIIFSTYPFCVVSVKWLWIGSLALVRCFVYQIYKWRVSKSSNSIAVSDAVAVLMEIDMIIEIIAYYRSVHGYNWSRDWRDRDREQRESVSYHSQINSISLLCWHGLCLWWLLAST